MAHKKDLSELSVSLTVTITPIEKIKLEKIHEIGRCRSLSATVGDMILDTYDRRTQPQMPEQPPMQIQEQLQPQPESKRSVGRPPKSKLATMEQEFDVWIQEGDPSEEIVKPFLEMVKAKKQLLMNMQEEERNAFVNSVRTRHENRKDGLEMEATIDEMIQVE